MTQSLKLTLLALAVASCALAQPAIKTGGIVNVSGYQATLAPGVVFVIFGSNMGPATIATAAAPNYPTSLSGTSITFTPTAGGSPVSAKIGLHARRAGCCPAPLLGRSWRLQRQRDL